MSKKIISIMVVMVMVVAGIFCTTSVSAVAFGTDLKGETEVEVGKTITLIVERWIANDVYEPDEDFIGLGETSREVVANSECKWSTSDESIAKVDENGKVTGVSEGKATITVICTNFGREDPAELEITVKAAAKIDEPSNDEPSITVPSTDGPTTPVKPDPSQEKPVNTGSDMTVVAVLAVVAAFAAVVIAGTKLIKKKDNE